jgi:cytochrome c-type biogenesis protein CcmH
MIERSKSVVVIGLVLATAAFAPCSAAADSVRAVAAGWLSAGLEPVQGAAQADLDAETTRLASEIRCPVCRGLSIEDSPTDLALEMKAVIRERLVQGESPDEVKAYFVARYGEWVLLKPTRSGFNVTLWALPLVVLLIAAGALAVAIRRWIQPEGPPRQTAGKGA